MVTPSTSLGSRSLVNCTRRHLAAHRVGERAREGGLADARDVLDEEVAAGEEGHERELDHFGLALEGVLHGHAELLHDRRSFAGDRERGGHRGDASTALRETREHGDKVVRSARPRYARAR
jgi:hypothetical protein